MEFKLQIPTLSVNARSAPFLKSSIAHCSWFSFAAAINAVVLSYGKKYKTFRIYMFYTSLLAFGVENVYGTTV
jgi:hypothetical protein